MSGAQATISHNLTVPLTDLVRAHVSDSRVTMPVRGPVYARLEHIAAVPASSSNGGYSLSRLQAIDSMLSRIARMQQELTPDVAQDPVDLQEAILEEAARRIVEEIRQGTPGAPQAQGLMLDMTA